MKEAVNVMNQQIEIATRYRVKHPYNKSLTTKSFGYFVGTVFYDSISIFCMDYTNPNVNRFNETLWFSTIIDFDPVEYTISCIYRHIADCEESKRCHKTEIELHNTCITGLEEEITSSQQEIENIRRASE
jgi:hypothetical protein